MSEDSLYTYNDWNNMKLRIRKISLIIAVAMIATLVLPANAVASENNVDSKYEELYNLYKDDIEFQRMQEAYGEEYAQEYIQKIAQREVTESMSRGGGGNYCYQYVKNIKQTKTYNCGTTTVLQTLYGLYAEDNVVGSTDAAKIATLDTEYNVDSQGSLYVYQVVNALNKYDSGTTYRYLAASNISTESLFEDYIATSLTYGRPIILHARTGYLTYYGGKNTGHYLNLNELNRTNELVQIVDCNYNTAYYGIHMSVPLSEAYNCIKVESGRYLIY